MTTNLKPDEINEFEEIIAENNIKLEDDVFSSKICNNIDQVGGLAHR